MQSLKKKKWIVILVSALTAITSFSVGFASWRMNGGDGTSIDIDADADEFNARYVEVYLIENISFDGFSFCENRGFVNDDGTYSNSIDFTGAFSFCVKDAKNYISSFNDIDMRFSIILDFTTNLMSDFSFGAPTISNFINNPVSVNVSGRNSTKSLGFNITLTSTEYETDILNDLYFSIPITYVGSSFPDLSGVTYIISLQPGDFLDD